MTESLPKESKIIMGWNNTEETWNMLWHFCKEIRAKSQVFNFNSRTFTTLDEFLCFVSVCSASVLTSLCQQIVLFHVPCNIDIVCNTHNITPPQHTQYYTTTTHTTLHHNNTYNIKTPQQSQHNNTTTQTIFFGLKFIRV